MRPSDTPAAEDDTAFGSHTPAFRRERAHERNLELERRLTKTSIQRRVDREPHARIKQSRSEAAMDRAGRVEMRGRRLGSDDRTPAGDLDNVIAERFGHTVQRQRASDEILHKSRDIAVIEH
jgi:hypothetical protein